MPIESRNPANGEVIASFDELTATQIEGKLATAQAAFGSWKRTSFPERSELMKRAAAELRNRKSELARLMSVEMGKITAAGLAEVEKCAMTCEYYANNAEAFLRPTTVQTEAVESYVQYDPLGIVLAVMPWNFPFWQVFRFAAPSLMAGNVGVLKHASNVPQCALAIEDVFARAGFPQGVFTTLLVGSGKVDALIQDPRVMAVTLTGSEHAGSQVASTAGKMIKKSVLELGGSDPFIVLEDADIEKAIQVAATARLQNNVGQSCIAAKRFIVAESVYEAFSEGIARIFEKLVLGDPQDPNVQVGPLSSEQIAKTIEEQVNQSVAQGAKVLVGGKRDPRPGYFYAPTVLTNVTMSMPVMNQEVFGPVAPVISFKTIEEAIEIANASEYGLGATVFTSDLAKAKEIATQIQSGAVFINGMVRSDPRLPFGGVKKSGFGRELGEFGIREFVNIKTVVVEKGANHAEASE